MFDFAGVMGYAVLMSMERSGTWCNVGRWNNVQEVLVGDKVFVFWLVEFRGRIMGASVLLSVTSNESSRGCTISGK
jgi:hypothetical protein